MSARGSLYSDVTRQDAVVLVTGGSGLVGKGIQELDKLKKIPGTWIFASSKDADLRFNDAALWFDLDPEINVALRSFDFVLQEHGAGPRDVRKVQANARGATLDLLSAI